MPTDNDDLSKIETIASLSNEHSTHTGAQGDYHYLSEPSMNANRPRLDSTACEMKTENMFRSNFASGEPEHYQKCLPTSSASFIVSSPSPAEIIIPENIDTIHRMIDSNTNSELCTSARTSNHHQQSLSWFSGQWKPVMVISGLLIIVMMTATVIVIYG